MVFALVKVTLSQINIVSNVEIRCTVHSSHALPLSIKHALAQLNAIFEHMGLFVTALLYAPVIVTIAMKTKKK